MRRTHGAQPKGAGCRGGRRLALTLNLGYGLIAFGGVLAIASLTFTVQLPLVAMIVSVVGIAAAIAGLVNVIVGAARAY